MDDGSPTGSAVPGILQARTLEWVAISFSNAWKWKVKVKLLGRVRLLATPWTAAHQAPVSVGFSRQEYCSGLPLPSPIAYSIIVCLIFGWRKTYINKGFYFFRIWHSYIWAWGFSRQDITGVGCHALLQGIFATQGSNPGLPHCRWILYHLSHQGSPIWGSKMYFNVLF